MTIDQEILNLINQERSNAGLNPLLLHSQLDSVANNHSEDMALEDFFSHTSSNGTNWSDRLAAVYQGTRLAENISAGLATPEAVVQDWMNSDPHRDNILDPNLEHIGIGYYHLPNDTGSVNYNHYWNLTFGAGGPPPVQVPDDDTNDTIAQATDTGLSGFGTYNISAEIDPQNDVDLFAVQLDAGDRLVADIDAELIGSSLDPILTVFDSAGTLVAQNDDDDSSLDSLIDFTAGVGNTYYVGVSSYANFDYDPLIEDSGTGDSSGFYDLYFSIDGPVVPNAEPNDTIAEATDTGLFGEGTYNISTEIGNNPNLVAPENDVDLFELYLDAGDRLVADIDAELIGSSLDPILTVFDSAGTLVAQNDDDDSSLDSLIDFTAGVGDTYYVGVSSYANFDYDPLIEDSGSGYSSGFYDLYLSIDVV